MRIRPLLGLVTRMLDADAEPADVFGSRALTPNFPEQPFALESARGLPVHTEARAARFVSFCPICCLNFGRTSGTGSVSSTVSDNMSNWDYWRGTFEAAQAQAQVAASQASKFAEVVSAQVRAHVHLCTQLCRMLMAAIITHAATSSVSKFARPLQAVALDDSPPCSRIRAKPSDATRGIAQYSSLTGLSYPHSSLCDGRCRSSRGS